MARLWSAKNVVQPKKPFIDSRNPSPTKIEIPLDFAQNPCRSIIGRPLSAILKKRLWAGMTVEAAVTVPLLLLFFLSMGSMIELLCLHGNVQFALWQAGTEAAVYGSTLADSDAAASILSSLYLEERVKAILGKEYLDKAPVQGGSSGLKVLALAKDDVLTVTAVYRAGVAGLPVLPDITLSNVFCSHMWTGGGLSGQGQETQTVYVTETGTVYHRSRDCTHLLLSVRAIDAALIGQQRNEWGRKYGACDRCASGPWPSTLYITREGLCYHYNEKCSGLKRTVYVRELSELPGSYRPCSRCGAGY